MNQPYYFIPDAQYPNSAYRYPGYPCPAYSYPVYPYVEQQAPPHMPQPPRFGQTREYPQVDTKVFHHSVTAFQKLMKEASLVLDKLSEPKFAYSLMAAAQTGNQKEVDRLMKATDGDSTITTKYTPTGVVITIDPNVPGTPCCTLNMSLKWGD